MKSFLKNTRPRLDIAFMESETYSVIVLGDTCVRRP